MENTGVSATAQASLAAALDRTWNKFLPRIVERATILQSAGEALAAGELSDMQRDKATAAAHSLAGVLGSFGLHEGTALAREAEVLYTGAVDANQPASERLQAIATQLRALIESRQ